MLGEDDAASASAGAAASHRGLSNVSHLGSLPTEQDTAFGEIDGTSRRRVLVGESSQTDGTCVARQERLLSS